MKHYTAKELNRYPTLSVGQTDDLKIDTGKARVWLARTTRADGEKFRQRISVEVLYDGRWIISSEYEGDA